MKMEAIVLLILEYRNVSGGKQKQKSILFLDPQDGLGFRWGIDVQEIGPGCEFRNIKFRFSFEGPYAV